MPQWWTRTRTRPGPGSSMSMSSRIRSGLPASYSAARIVLPFVGGRSVGPAAAQQVDRVRQRREDDLQTLERAVARARQVADDRRTDRAAHAAAEHAERPARRVARAPHRLREAGRLAVDDHARALGSEVPWAEAGAAGCEHHPGEAGHQVTERERDLVDAVGRHAVLEHRPPLVVQPLDHLGARAVLTRPLVHTVGHHEDLGRQLHRHVRRAHAARPCSAAARMARPAATGSGAWNNALPATRMSHPAAAAAEAVSALMPPSISISTGHECASISLRATRTLSSTSGMNDCPPHPGLTLITRSMSIW